jgi:hypothetical protein
LGLDCLHGSGSISLFDLMQSPYIHHAITETQCIIEPDTHLFAIWHIGIWDCSSLSDLSTGWWFVELRRFMLTVESLHCLLKQILS